MKKFRILPILMALTAFALIVGACNVPNQPSGQALDTAAARTIEARVTQMAFETLAARVTDMAKTQAAAEAATATQAVQPTLAPTQTPLPTYTPLPSFTPLPTLVPATWTPLPPTAIPTPCNWAGFVKDVTIPDGTKVMAGEKFVKTWRLVNKGTCTWNDNYDLIFDSGNQMGAASTIDLSGVKVAPGQTLDVSVSLTAPDKAGSFTGNWKLRSDKGVVFGIGSNYNSPFWVKIEVAETAPSDPDTVYDFAANYCSAKWTANDTLTCPSPAVDYVKGSIQRVLNPRLEGDRTENEPALVTVPPKGDTERIVGRYPAITIKDGYSFRAIIGCMYGAKKCDVDFRLRYSIDNGDTIETLEAWDESYDGDFTKVNVDLSALAGKKVIFYLTVYSTGDPTDDQAFWLAPRIAK